MLRYLDQIVADEIGYKWLYTWIDDNEDVADRIESSNHENDGRTVVAWAGNKPVAMFTIIRDQLNWSILITHTFEEE